MSYVFNALICRLDFCEWSHRIIFCVYGVTAGILGGHILWKLFQAFRTYILRLRKFRLSPHRQVEISMALLEPVHGFMHDSGTSVCYFHLLFFLPSLVSYMIASFPSLLSMYLYLSGWYRWIDCKGVRFHLRE